MPKQQFSQELQIWLENDDPKTIQGLIDSFAEKSFAILLLVLMITPALPLPTGGVTHVFEIIAMLLALEQVVGLSKIWLPTRWRRAKLPARLQQSTLPVLIKGLRKVESLPGSRRTKILDHRLPLRVIGLIVFLLSLSAFLAPPFSGLDTFPSLGVVIISLALILENIYLLALGVVVGIAGISLIIGVSKALLILISNLR